LNPDILSCDNKPFFVFVYSQSGLGHVMQNR
jgi:hypothetical protein